RAPDVVHAVREDAREADDDRRREVARREPARDVEQIDRARRVGVGIDRERPMWSDTEVAGAPLLDAVELGGVLRGPEAELIGAGRAYRPLELDGWFTGHRAHRQDPPGRTRRPRSG